MQTAERIGEILSIYKKNMDRQNELDSLLLSVKDKEEWIGHLKKRAVENHKMYTENGELLDEFEQLLAQSLNADEINRLYDETYTMYWDGYDDCRVLLPMIYKLLDYFEKEDDIDKLLFLYGAAYYEENEIQNRCEGNSCHDETYIFKILNHCNQYSSLSFESRKRIWASYYNLVVSGLGNKSITARESYDYYRQATDFWNTSVVQELDGNNEEILQIVRQIKTEWLVVEEFIDNVDSETKEFFCRRAKEVYDEEMLEKSSIYEINSEVYAAYLHSLVLKNERTMDEIVDIYMEYYKEKLKDCPEPQAIGDEDFYFIINTPLIIEKWLHHGVSEQKSKNIMGMLKTMTLSTWYYKLNNCDTPFLNALMAEWFFKLIKHLDSQDEKEDCIFQLLVRRQLPTYMHSVMVMTLADALCQEVLRCRPELFDELNFSSTEALMDFVHQCGLLHDIGKNQNNQYCKYPGTKIVG